MKIKNTNVESASFAFLTIVDNNGKTMHELRQYWSVNAGTYGHQVCQQEWHANAAGELQYSEWKSSGCGYCKESAGFEQFCKNVFGEYKSIGGRVDYYLHKYKKGGNYFECTFEQFKEAVK